MIETEVFQKNFVGRDGFIWWIGQIASDSWAVNAEGSAAVTRFLKIQKGFDYRYQVRIMGYHTADKRELPDDQLPWATIVYPVTAGAGAGGFATSPNMKQGNFVYGFFMDGEDAQQPVIMGVLGYNQYQEVLKVNPPIGFAPFQGFKNPLLNGIPIFALAKAAQEKFGVFGGNAKSKAVTGAAGESSTKSIANDKEKSDGEDKNNLDSPCDKSATGIQKTIRNLIKSIEKVQKGLDDFSDDLTDWNEEIIETEEWIQKKLEKAAKDVTKWMKDKIKAIFKWISNKFKKKTDKVVVVLPKDKQTDVKSGIEKALELLKCAFDKIIAKLFKIVLNALKEAALRWINVPLCAAENIMAALIGKLMGLINGIVNMISGIINGVLGAVGQAIDIMDDVIGFLDAILSIFELCDPEKPECPRVTDWSIWDGSDSLDNPFDIGGLVDKIKGFASGVSDIVDIDNFDFDLDFSDIFDTSMCDTGPQFCGPPQVILWGGSGHSAAGNAIVSAVGDIIGVDVINSGTGYASDPPYVRFQDDCGNGNGAVGTAVTGPVSPTDLKPYRAKRQNINKKPPASPNDWELLTIPSEGLPLWDPAVTYYGERIRSTPSIEYLPSAENANLKKLYESKVETKDSEGNVILKGAEENGYQASMSVGVVTYTDVIIPADIVAFSPKWTPDDGGDYVGVTGVVMNETGFGYLPVPNGDQGGDGRIWAPANHSTVEKSNGEWDRPYPPGSLIPVMKGDTLCTPVGSVTELRGMDGKVTEILGGCTLIPGDGVVGAPEGTGVSREAENVYPLVLYVCSAIIVNPGFGYQEGDKVVLEPDNGAEITPKFGNFGNLISLEVVSGGEGFQEMPIAYIESETGINAEISIRLCIDRIGDDAAKEPGVQDKVVSVVDCVGTV